MFSCCHHNVERYEAGVLNSFKTLPTAAKKKNRIFCIKSIVTSVTLKIEIKIIPLFKRTKFVKIGEALPSTFSVCLELHTSLLNLQAPLNNVNKMVGVHIFNLNFK